MPLVLGPLLVGLLPFLAAIVLLGLSQASTSQHGSDSSGNFWDFITGKTYLHQVGGFAASFARWIVSRFAAGQLVMLARWFHNIGTLTIGWFIGIALFSESIVSAVERLEHEIPREIHRAVNPVLRLARIGVRKAEHALTVAESAVHALHRFETRVNHRLHAAEHAIAVTLPREIGHIRSGEEALSRDLAKVRERTRELENGATRTFEWIRTHPLSAATGIFAGAVAVALSRLGFGFMRCRSWQKLGRSLTCNDANILADLLAAATLVVGAMSLVELAREEQKVVGEAAKIVRGFWEL